MAAGELRGDLYYRLNVFSIQMPPLRDHLSDIPAIVDRMITEMNARHGCTVTGVDAALMERLMGYKWPGNVRELRTTVERATILAGTGRLRVEHLPANFGEPGFSPPPPNQRTTRAYPMSGMAMPDATAEVERWRREENSVRVEVGTTVDEAERQLILKTLNSTNNNKTKAAEILGISSKTLQNKLKEYAAAAGATVDGTE